MALAPEAMRDLAKSTVGRGSVESRRRIFADIGLGMLRERVEMKSHARFGSERSALIGGDTGNVFLICVFPSEK